MGKLGAYFHDMSVKGLKKQGQSNDRIKHVMAFRDLDTPAEKLSYLEANRSDIEKHFRDVDKLIESWRCQ